MSKIVKFDEEAKRGLEKAVAAAIDSIKSQARDVEGRQEIAHVASISANNDPEIGEMVAEAMDKVGKDGVITVEESNTFGLELELVEGMQFDKGYISPYLVTDQDRMEAVLEDPYILLAQQKISNVRDLLPVLEKVMQGGKALLQDMAILTGGQVISEEIGLKLESARLDMLGRARKVVVSKDNTTIVEGQGDSGEIKGRIEQIRAEIERTDSDWDREKLQERLAKLAGGVAVLKVGAATEVELKEKKHRIEDSVSATRAAVEEGIVPGGGTTLLRAREAIDALEIEDDEAIGSRIVMESLDAPLWWIAQNAGFEGGVVVERVREEKPGHGLNAATGEYVDLFAAGIIDPVRVTRSALENAASIAALMLTTEATIAEKPEEEDEDAAAA